MKRIASIMIISLIAISCISHKKTGGIYRYFWGNKDNYRIWIIDGDIVRQMIYKEFLYGGNEQRYLFVPKGEIWIDNDISSEEFDLTVAHELNERHLMAKFGWTYPDFGDSGNDLTYHFIPSREIWIDGQVSCEETEYSVLLEMTERKLMEEGKSYSDAYESAVQMVQDQREKMASLAGSHFKIAIPDSLSRDAGLIDPYEK